MFLSNSSPSSVPSSPPSPSSEAGSIAASTPSPEASETGDAPILQASFENQTLTNKMATTSSLAGLQSEEQSHVLDIVQQLRQVGLDSVLSLPQLVVCGDQSAGKSSVLEALTEIPFPRNDNLCTRFATEINLRRGATDSLTLKLIPDSDRPDNEKALISSFKENITDFQDLPAIMEKAMAAMGIGDLGAGKAFAKDVLSIDIEGPSRPQLSLVDLPGLIQNESKGITAADVKMVAAITDQYISQSRTICLAVVTSANDYANQGIITKVRTVDKEGQRTLGIITKPDRLDAGSEGERAFINLALNKDIFFKLGWHCLKNRKYEEKDYSFEDRNKSEVTFFATSNFRSLPKETTGITSLRVRLSQLLFAHIKSELPKLQGDLKHALAETKKDLDILGVSRATTQECRSFLTQLSQSCYNISKAAVDGHYDQPYFVSALKNPPKVSTLDPPTRRLRAKIQNLNESFNTHFRRNAHTYQIVDSEHEESDDDHGDTITPKTITRAEALKWVKKGLTYNRGRELSGNFNPLVVGELFWEQAKHWEELARDHLELVAETCADFLKDMVKDKCPSDIQDRLMGSLVEDALKTREHEAVQELKHIMDDVKSYPINYNHYYTDIVKRGRQKRELEALAAVLNTAKSDDNNALYDGEKNRQPNVIDINAVIEHFKTTPNPDIERHSCEEALDCLLAIYKVHQKTFVANIVTQVIERHIVRGLEGIFSPVVVDQLSDEDIKGIAAEPTAIKDSRIYLEDRLEKLEKGRKILRQVMRVVV
ncbi:hypothetical protein EG328_011109 [Venturia inaequalis]|uniref:Uncharacterized protein n=1 Tax=Venturia inaequalis TaxID=5025 RepID=A0A8H3Z6B7_VENIN|nr:hypothetical protein EG328_011109 [Venturia inaequalis]